MPYFEDKPMTGGNPAVKLLVYWGLVALNFVVMIVIGCVCMLSIKRKYDAYRGACIKARQEARDKRVAEIKAEKAAAANPDASKPAEEKK